MYTYVGVIVAVHDGDTFTADLDLGFGLWKRNTKLRLNGCNAIELKNSGGIEARDNLISLLPAGSRQIIYTYKPYKYGDEWMADVEISTSDITITLVNKLLHDGWVAPWNGQGTPPVPIWPRTGQ